MSTYNKRNGRDRSRSPRRKHSGNDRSGITRRVPFHYDEPKFGDSPKRNQNSKIVNQLSTDALYKQNRSRNFRSNNFSDNKRFNEFKPRRYNENHDSNYSRQRTDSSRNDYDRRERRDKDERRDERRSDESAFKINSSSVPRSGYYFEHDTRLSDDDRDYRRREDRSFRSDRHKDRESSGTLRREVRANESSRRRDDDTYGSKRSDFSKFAADAARNYGSHSYSKERPRTDGFWRHDKYEALELDVDINRSEDRKDIKIKSL